MAGDYKCTSSNTATHYTQSSEKTVSVVVQYAPDVTVRHSSKSTTEGETLTLYCEGSGVPSTYNYVSLKQTWRNTEIPNNNKAQTGMEQYSSITFSPLTLEDTGTYTCILNNGIKDTAGVLDQSGSTQLLVKVRPKVLTDERRFVGSVGGTVHVEIPIYSYPIVESLTITKYDGEVISSDRYYLTSQEMKTVFYGKPVILNGSRIHLTLTNLDEMNFGSYSFKLTNLVGITYFQVFVTAEDRPQPPKDFQIFSDLSIPTFLWQKDFNGGLHQSFIIQTLLASTEQWTSQINIHESDTNYQINSTFYMANISGLQPGIYIARMFSSNAIGNSDYIYLEKTFEVVGDKDSTEKSKSFSAATVAAGVSSAVVGVVVVIAIAFFIWKKRKNEGRREQETHDNSKLSPSSQDQYEDLQVLGERETDHERTYDSLQKTNSETGRSPAMVVNSGSCVTGSVAVYENLKLKGMAAVYSKSKN